jgi:hypothetical protein
MAIEDKRDSARPRRMAVTHHSDRISKEGLGKPCHATEAGHEASTAATASSCPLAEACLTCRSLGFRDAGSRCRDVAVP